MRHDMTSQEKKALIAAQAELHQEAQFPLSWLRRSRLDVASVELVQLIASSSDEVEPVAIRILRTLLLESVLGHAYSIGYGYGGGRA